MNTPNVTPQTHKHSRTQATTTPNKTTKPKSADNDPIVQPELPSVTISNMDHNYFRDNSNESQVSQFVPLVEYSDSDSSISYADELVEQHTEFEDILLDGLTADDCTAEYLKKWRI